MTVLAGEVQRLLDGLVELLRLTDLAAGVRGVVLLVDRALSTWRKNPFFLPVLLCESRSMDLLVIDLRSGTWLKLGSGRQLYARPSAPLTVAGDGANFTGRVPGANSPRSGLF